MSNICYHSFKTKESDCRFCGHSIKPQNLYKVICPGCDAILIADVNSGIECGRCGEMFEAFEVERWHIDI